MQLLIIRHGIAGEREEFARTGRDDSERPLTKHGKRQMKRIAKGMHRVLKQLDVLGASPLVRAQQTAEIVAERYREMEVKTVPSLEPGSAPEDFAAWLGRQRLEDVVGAVGHDPHLGVLATWLIAGQMEPGVHLEKGGACLLDVEGAPRAGCGTMLWALTPDMLIRIAD